MATVPRPSRGEVWLIDFEGAHESGVEAPTAMFTPGFAPVQMMMERSATAALASDAARARCGRVTAAASPAALARAAWANDFVRGTLPKPRCFRGVAMTVVVRAGRRRTWLLRPARP